VSYATRDWAGRTPVTEYLVIYDRADDGSWGAHSPDVEDAFALGRTRPEVESRMAEALAAHLDYLRNQGAPEPQPHTDAGRIAVA
jgi:predicted RNase H-like HicB family nuclease